MGQRRDAALREDALLSARELTNFDLDYDGESADLVIRPGFTRWNAVELPASAQQLYPFVDMDQNFNLLGIADSRWRAIKESGAHVTLVDEVATATRPVEAFGNRAFFGTDTDAYWTDDASIPGANPSFRMGIAKPANALDAVLAVTTGVTTPSIATPRIWLNSTTRFKFASPFVLASAKIIESIWLCVAVSTALALDGSVVLKIYTDDSGSPSTTLADVDLVSWEWPVQNLGVDFAAGAGGSNIWDNTKRFEFKSPVELPAGTYWAVLESDQEYRDNYGTGTPDWACYINYSLPGSPAWGYSKWWDDSGAAWVVTSYQPNMRLGGIDTTYWYDYVTTYVNTKYNSESRPSASVRLKPIADPNYQAVSISGLVASGDPQVDKVRIYRRQVTNADDTEDDIITDYLLLKEIDAGETYLDELFTTALSSRLASQDHYLYDEADDTNQGKRDAFVPAGFVLWKGRIWAWEASTNKFYFTKTFEIDNPNGLTGESSPDYFPLDNVLDFPVPSGIINAKALSNDQMAVYFRNEQIWIVSGGDSVLNPPPPSDIAIRPTAQTIGLFAPDAVVPYSNSNIFVGREGLYRFQGIGSRPELLSETQGGILDDIENQYFRNSKVVVYGREVWLLIDSDNDGDLDKILILDLERDFQTRTMVDRAWRGREYPVAINDLAVHSTGDEFREILAADAVDGWIMKLNDGDDDNGAAIVGTAESHDIRAPRNSSINQLLIQAFYNDEDNLPDYDLTVTSHAGDTFQISMEGGVDITGNEDIRGHSMGLRMKRPISVRLKVVMTSTKRDRIRGFTFSYERE